MSDDKEHLRLLAIFHYIVGGMVALASCVFIVYLVFGFITVLMGLLVTVAGSANNQTSPAAGIPFLVLGAIELLIPITLMLIGWISAFFIIQAGRCLHKVKSKNFCFVIACMECFVFPLGTALGVFTIIVLNKDSVIKQKSNQ